MYLISPPPASLGNSFTISSLTSVWVLVLALQQKIFVSHFLPLFLLRRHNSNIKLTKCNHQSFQYLLFNIIYLDVVMNVLTCSVWYCFLLFELIIPHPVVFSYCFPWVSMVPCGLCAPSLETALLLGCRQTGHHPKTPLEAAPARSHHRKQLVLQGWSVSRHHLVLS